MRTITLGFLICLLLLPIGATGANEDAASEATELIVKRVLPGVVSVRAQNATEISAGSGFVVESDGVVVTNLHVIRGSEQVAIKLHSGEIFDDVRVIGFDERRDLAVLKFAGYGLPVLSLGDSDTVEPGERVLAIGHPLGLENSVTEGIVSSVRVLDSGIKTIQTDAAVSKGNSGGPLLNDKGEVIGVVTFKIVAGESLNFTVPVNYVRGLLSLKSQLTLTELAARLDRNAELFEVSDDSKINGNWKSLESGSIKKLWEDGDYIYGEVLNESGGSSTTVYEFKRQPDGTYKGAVRYRGTYGGRKETAMTILKIENSRMEILYKRDHITWVKIK